MAQIFSTITSGRRPYAAVMDRRPYVVDGWQRMRTWDGLAANASRAGITGPGATAGTWAPTPGTASGSPGLDAGVHLIRYRYKNSKTGAVSEPSNEVSYTALGGQLLTFGGGNPGSGAGNLIISTDGGADRWVIEMTAAGGSTFFLAGEFPQAIGVAAVTLDVDDVTLSDSPLPWLSESQGLPVHLPPPIVAHVLYHRDRLWGYGHAIYSTGTVAVTNGSTSVTGTGTVWSPALASTLPSGCRRTPLYFQKDGDTAEYEIDSASSDTALTLVDAYAGSTSSGSGYRIYSKDRAIYYSEAGLPESWPTASFIPGPEQGPVRALAGMLGGMVIYSLASMEYFRYTTEPSADGVKRHVSSERGAVNPRVVVVHEERAYALDRRGVHVFQGTGATHLSRPIDTIVQRINWTVEETFHACYYPRLHAIRWWVALDADTVPKHYLQLNLGSGTWCMGEREVGVTASALVQTESAGARVWLGDENGHRWFDDEGETDGADSTPRATVASGATTTVVPIQSGVTLPTSGTGLTGVVAWHERLNEARVVTANTGSGFTVGTAFSEAPRYGDKIHFGRIKAKLRPRVFVFEGFPRKHKPRHVHVWFVPTSSQRYALLRVYRDHSDSAEAGWSETMRDTPPRGTVAPQTATATDWKIDLSTPGGCVRVGLGDEASWATEVELEFRESDARAQILGLAVDALSTDAPV